MHAVFNSISVAETPLTVLQTVGAAKVTHQQVIAVKQQQNQVLMDAEVKLMPK
jgi:hypothetical protein